MMDTVGILQTIKQNGTGGKDLEQGANTSIRNTVKNTRLLRKALEKGEEDNKIRLLLESEIDVNHKAGRWERTLLHVAALVGRANVVEWLLNRGADINATDLKNRTALHMAASVGCAKVVKLLLNRGANINARDLIGETALYVACLSAHLNIVILLLDSGADVDIVVQLAHTALYAASYGEETDIMKPLVKLLVTAMLLKDPDRQKPDGHEFFHKEELLGIWDVAQKEIREMQGIKISGSRYSLYDCYRDPYAFRSSNHLIEIEKAIEMFSPAMLVDKFPTVSLLLEKRRLTILEMLLQRRACLDKLCNQYGVGDECHPVLNPDVMLLIVKELPNSDFKNLNQALFKKPLSRNRKETSQSIGQQTMASPSSVSKTQFNCRRARRSEAGNI